MKKAVCLILALTALTLSLCSCSNTENQSAASVVTTVFPVYDWVRVIMGSDDSVAYLGGSGADMHSFDPTASDIAAISRASAFIYIGGESEDWAQAAIDAAGNPSLKTLPLSTAAQTLAQETVQGMQSGEHDHDNASESFDEHIWLSLSNAAECVEAICETLCECFPDNARTYRQNAEEYIGKLNELDGRYRQTVERAQKKCVIVADRFPFIYLMKAYSLDYYAAFPGCSAETEASFETLAFLIEKTRETGVKSILVTETSDKSLAETIAEETGADVLTLNSCQSVTLEAADGTSYLSVMTENLSVLGEALEA